MAHAIIGGREVLAVDGRALHAFLGVAHEFRFWVVSRISEYGFAENVDFEVSLNSSRNPQGAPGKGIRPFARHGEGADDGRAHGEGARGPEILPRVRASLARAHGGCAPGAGSGCRCVCSVYAFVVTPIQCDMGSP
ncbi:antA/AntB antirepressor family protein [Burkholderia sp. 22313]|uniref:antA/AntB antirepressor family protein n=1 Tax=Burkholderia sp. 22313 TaxID=3453908 RepID=UPI003F8463AC